MCDVGAETVCLNGYAAQVATLPSTPSYPPYRILSSFGRSGWTNQPLLIMSIRLGPQSTRSLCITMSRSFKVSRSLKRIGAGHAGRQGRAADERQTEA
jgi:hypothetical protein